MSKRGQRNHRGMPTNRDFKFSPTADLMHKTGRAASLGSEERGVTKPFSYWRRAPWSRPIADGGAPWWIRRARCKLLGHARYDLMIPLGSYCTRCGESFDDERPLAVAILAASGIDQDGRPLPEASDKGGVK